jgi:hypothetical protein
MSLRFSQLAVEAIQRPTTARVHMSQLAIEAIQRPTTARVRLSQIAVEIISHNGASGSGSSAGSGMLIVAT